MQWSEVIKPPSPKMLRQFAGLFLIVFLGMAAMRWWRGHADAWAGLLATVAVVVGLAGMAVPAAIRPIYTAWMIAAFPIGWTISRLALGTIFFVVMTPLAAVFRLIGRDELRLRRAERVSYWVSKKQSGDASEYFRQF